MGLGSTSPCQGWDGAVEGYLTFGLTARTTTSTPVARMFWLLCLHRS
jgi:hypothetical protein